MASKISRRDLSSDINELLDIIDGYKGIIESLKSEIDELKKQIPNKLSQLENDTNYITSNDNSITSKAPINNPNFIGSLMVNDLNVATKVDIPNKVSQLENDTNYIDKDSLLLLDKANINNPSFTGVATINNMAIAKVTDIPKKASQLENDTNYITRDDVAITGKANRPTPGVNVSINDINPYPFCVTGDEYRAAGITFDRGNYRVNLGIDVDNKLKIGGGTSYELREIVDETNILDILFNKDVYLVVSDGSGPIFNGREGQYKLRFDEISKSFIFEKI